MATRSEQLNWQEIHLSEDEASAQGTHAVRFLVQQVEKAQNNSPLRPMLNNLMRAHGLQLVNYEPPTQDPSFQEALNEGNAIEERGAHSQDDASSGRSRSPSRRIRRPLEREDNSLRFRNRDISIHTEDRGSTIPIVSHANLQKSMKSNLFAYMIFAQESKQHELSVEQKDQQEFLNSFKDCFADEIPKELPPSRGEDDHKIELIPGHIISKEGIRMDPEKLRVIDKWPEPCNVHELRSFLGMCSYYRRFIRDFSRIAGPLHELTKKKAKYVWTPKENTAFMQLKAKLMTQPLLVLPDLKKPFEVHCDACGDSIGAILSQEGHPIAYESRHLNSQERGLGVYEKELISVIHALQSWKHYLLGTAFVIYTDHQSIRYFMTQTKLSEKQMRWANFLSQFHFHIAHVAERKIK
ncbi:hypothetical protein L7F22_042845 [Adiantum nelumboides]|nr:hypothetical protein [Adiantum nelumboides]